MHVIDYLFGHVYLRDSVHYVCSPWFDLQYGFVCMNLAMRKLAAISFEDETYFKGGRM